MTRSQQTQSTLLAVILFAGAFVAYYPALHGNYIWDDDHHVSENHTLRSLQGLRRIWTSPDYLPQWYPMTHTSFWLEYQLWGLDTTGYHFDNILLHAANAWLLYLLLKRLDLPGAEWAVVVFAFHPIEAETVAWITERKNLLSMFFELLAVLSYLRAFHPLPALRPAVSAAELERDGVSVISEVENFSQPEITPTLTLPSSAALTAGRSTGRGNRIKLYSLATLLFIAALLSKTVACSAPAVILLLLWWKRQLSWRDAAWLAPWFLLGAAMARFTSMQEINHVGAHGPEWNFTFAQRILIAGRAIWFYAGKLLWPRNLIFSYPRWNVVPGQLWQWLFPLCVVLVLKTLWVLRKRIGRGPIVAAMLFCGILVPALGFTDLYPMRYSFVADHFQYAAGIALIAGIASLIAKRIPEQIPAIVPAIIPGIVLLVLTWHQAHIYAGPEPLWTDVIAKNNRSWMAMNNLGVDLAQIPNATIAQLQHSVALFERVHELEPTHDKMQIVWGDALCRLGRYAEALPHYAIKGDDPAALTQAARALVLLNRLPEAEQKYRLSLSHKPDNAVRVLLADTLAEEHRDNEAIKEYEAASDQSAASLGIARIRARADQFSQAAEAYEKYLNASPRNAPVHEELGWVYLRLGNREKAQRHFSAALDLVPDFASAREGLIQSAALPGTMPVR